MTTTYPPADDPDQIRRDIERTQDALSNDVDTSTGAAVSDAASSAVGTVQDAPRAIRRQAQGNPLAAGVIAFGAGWLISSLLPASRREEELAEMAKDRATVLGKPLAGVAAELKDQLAEPAQQAVAAVRSTATDAGQTVVDEGRGAAGSVRDDARDAAGTVKQNSSSNWRRIRVASLNIASGRDASGRSADAAGLAAASADLVADVVAVQEIDSGQPRSHGVDQPPVLARALGAVDWRWAPTVAGTPGPAHGWRPIEPVALLGPGDAAPGPRYGVAVFSRLPVRRWHVLGLRAGRSKLPLPTGGSSPRLWWVPDEPRAAIAAELDGLTVIGTHLSFAPHTATRQLLRLRSWARTLPGPVLIAGDLNLIGSLPEYVTGGTRLVHAPTFPSHDPQVQLDHLLALGDLRGTDPLVRRLPVGDHCVVAVTVT